MARPVDVGDLVTIDRTSTTYVAGRMDALIIPAGTVGKVVARDDLGLVVAFPSVLDAVDISRGYPTPRSIVPRAWLLLGSSVTTPRDCPHYVGCDHDR